jgi:hypothetical protein
MTSPGWAQAAQWSHGVSKTNCRRISSLPRVIRRLNASVAIMIHGTESRHHAPQKDMENSQRQGYTPAQMMVCSSLPAADNMNGGLPPLCLPSPPPSATGVICADARLHMENLPLWHVQICCLRSVSAYPDCPTGPDRGGATWGGGGGGQGSAGNDAQRLARCSSYMHGANRVDQASAEWRAMLFSFLQDVNFHDATQAIID